MRQLKVKRWGQEESELLSLFERVPADYSFPFELGAILLSKRGASRGPRDIAIIWSLLCPRACGHETFDDMAQLLSKVAQGPGIHTGFLMATMPRLRVPGLCWGPTGDRTSEFNYRTSAKGSDNSELGRWHRNFPGLTARWLVWELNSPSDWPPNFGLVALPETEPLDVSHCLQSGQRLALLQAADRDGRLCHSNLRSYITSRRLVAVCVCLAGEGTGRYQWRGLFNVIYFRDDPGNITARFSYREITLL
jgi:hypothetical protein